MEQQSRQLPLDVQRQLAAFALLVAKAPVGIG
jgi:hypothetical protein